MVEKLVFEYRVFKSDDISNPIQNHLINEAKLAQRRAYAPYSKFTVGAAVLLGNNSIVTGNNQENMAYPSGLCAERVALFSASSQYPDIEVKSIAIFAGNFNFPLHQPVSPCGACRQCLLEYEIRQEAPIEILMAGNKSDVYLIPSVKSLLPLHFHENRLKH